MFSEDKNRSYLYEDFVVDVTLDKVVSIKFWNSSESRIRIPTPDLDWIFLGRGPYSPSALVFSCNCIDW